MGRAFTVTESNIADNRSERSHSLICKLVAEFIGDLIFVFVGSSQALANNGVINAAFAHGITIFVLVAALGHISGGHFNPAVTLAIALCGKIKIVHAVLYALAQLLGGFVGSLIVRAMVTQSQFNTILGGATLVGDDYHWYQGFIAEIMSTFFLAQSVLMTAVDTSSNILAPLAIGFTLTLDIFAVGPISGASMNPARSFGPAITSTIFGIGHSNSYIWRHHYIYWAGPVIGAAIAAFLFRTFFRRSSKRLVP
uniref:Aquaporin n=1 Tax=Syphacia muris TaxID=451379 RepID=A0A0N5ASX0_9BILA